jgi:beta-galactosidase
MELDAAPPGLWATDFCNQRKENRMRPNAGSCLNARSEQSFVGETVRINEGWSFHPGDSSEALRLDCEDLNWRVVNLPHDWSVEGSYSRDLASATGYLPGGLAWYRKRLRIPASRKGGQVRIYFEGIYRNSEVFINGKSVGKRPSGYLSFEYDLTPHIAFGEENLLAVKVDHRQHADSRWYTGSGIYRDVFLRFLPPVHFDLWGVHYTTPEISAEQAAVRVCSSVCNAASQPVEISVVQKVFESGPEPAAQSSEKIAIAAGAIGRVEQLLHLHRPKLWSVETPYLYRLETALYCADQLLDRSTVSVGIRSVHFDADRGFFLTGTPMKLKGVCLHHDAGSLGAAVPREVWERRLETLKSLGVNAIRTSHNPQAPVFYDLCDRFGFLVMDEAFDEWEFPKKKWIEGWNVGTPGFQGHAEFFEEWAEKDLRDMVLRDRNHPCVILWSIGNEVDYPNDPYSHPILDEEGIEQQHTAGYLPEQPPAERLGEIARRLAAVVRACDPSRPVTAALAGPVMSNETAYPAALDVVGYNYTERRYREDRERFPGRVLYGSENRHAMADWKAVRDQEFIAGQFLWSGIDYLGEAGPWPSRGFTCGLLDLAGFPKPRGMFRKSLWTAEPMICLGTCLPGEAGKMPQIDCPPAWNYASGETVRVVAYTNCKRAKLLLNDSPAGEVKEYDDDTGTIVWEIPFQPGTLEAVALQGETEVARTKIQTHGPAHAIQARTWCETVVSQRGVAQIELQIVDREGLPVYDAMNLVRCRVDGPVKLLALEAGNPADMGCYRRHCLNAYHGRMIAYLEATGASGTARVRFSSNSLEGAVAIVRME